MKRLRFPVPLAVLAAACTTGCCSFCMRPIDPVYWDYDFEPPAAIAVRPHAEFAEVESHAESAEFAEVESHAESAEFAEAESHAEAAVPAFEWPFSWIQNLPDELPFLIARRHQTVDEIFLSCSGNLEGVTPEAYPDADEVSLFEWEDTRYETNGTYTTTWKTLSKILTQRGLENNRTFSFSNDDFYGSTTVLVARVHSPDGSRRDIDLAANLAEAVDTGSLASNIHDPNEKKFTLALPGLQVGDAIELKMRRTARRPRCEGVYSDYLTFENDHPILFQGARITGPASMPLRSRAFRDAGPVKLFHGAHTNETAGTVTEVWTAENVPRYFAEPDMPPAYDCTARLLLSTAPDWESLSRWYARLCAPHLAATNEAMALKVAELVASATGSATGGQGENAAEGGFERAQGAPGTPAEPALNGGEAALRTRADDLPPATRAAVVRALFDFVSREVRYMGAMAESEAPGYEPHDVSLTFDNRYGVCRDKAALLVAMLRMAGIDAWPVLINVGPRKDPQVPQPYFNHAIVAADSGDPDDPYVLMDPTSETTRSLLPEYLCEMSYLVAREDGETIRETPPLPVEENMLRAHVVFTLNGDASADVTTTLSFLGVNDAAYRGYFASIPRDDIRAFFERLLRGVPGAVLTCWELHPAPEDLRKSSEPLVATVEYAIAEAARGAEGGRTAFLDLPDLAGSLAIASRVVGDLGLEKRRFPLVTDYPCGFEETVELRTPNGVNVVQRPPIAFPADTHAEFAKAAEFDSHAESAENAESSIEHCALSIEHSPSVLFQDIPTESGRHRSLKLFRSRYSPEEYRSLREAREAQERADRAPILLEGEGVPRMFEGRAFGSGLQDVLARAVEPAPADDVFWESQHTTVDVSRAPEEWTAESTIRYRILAYSGLRKNGDVTFRWNPATAELSVTNAFVVSPDEPERGVAGLLAKVVGAAEPPGTVTPIDPKLDLFTGDQEWVADAPRYPAGKITTVSFPKLAPGCTVEYTVVRRAHDRDFFSLSHDLGILKSFGEVSVTVVGTNEIARSFRVEDPYWKTIADRFPVETNATDGATTFTVRGGGPGSQIVSEPNMPPISRLVPVLRASTQTAPERARAVAERMWALSDPAVQTNAAALARSLVATNATVREAFVALRDWCAVNLREAGPAYWDLPLSALSPADATLAARYGHEADIRILQLAMARALPEALRPSFPDDTPPDGPDEGPARARSGSGERHRILIRLYNGDWDGLPERRLDRDPEPASPAFYDTIAVALSESRSDGCVLWDDDYLFDGATHYAPALSSRNRGRIYVEASSGNDWTPAWTTIDESPDPRASEMEPAYESMDGTSTEYDIALREDGSARVAVRIRHSGTDFEAFRKRYEQILPEERRRDAQRRVAALAQSARLVGEVETETPPEGPCVMRFEAEVPDFAVREGDRLVLRVPEPSPLSPPARTRRFPFRRTSPEFEGVTTVLRPPAGWRAVSVPASGISHVSRNDGFGARRDVWTSRGPDGELVFRGVLELERTEFGADRYGAFLRATLGGRGPDAATVVLERAP